MILIKNIRTVNEGEIEKKDILIKEKFIFKISEPGEHKTTTDIEKIIDGEGKTLFPGIIDMHVHFREPGLTHKAETSSETKAALTGGVTSYAEMPNTIPKTIGVCELRQKYNTGKAKSYINYSYFLGGFNENTDTVKQYDNTKIPGVKIFMGTSTGSMQISDAVKLEVFKQNNLQIVAHCEDDEIINKNTAQYIEKYGDEIPFKYHSNIRSEEACYKSSFEAVELANKYNSKLHIAHISTEKELSLFDRESDVRKKQITSEVCIHHLWFNEDDYNSKGSLIKWNPAVKKESDRLALIQGLKDNTIDIVVTDHAPHTFEEKQQPYTKAPSGGPMIQHSLQAMITLSEQGHFPLELIAEKMCHNPALLYNIEKRGFIKEGFYADLVIVDMTKKHTVSKENILYKCGWSPMEGVTFGSSINTVLVNGELIYDSGLYNEKVKGMALEFQL